MQVFLLYFFLRACATTVSCIHSRILITFYVTSINLFLSIFFNATDLARWWMKIRLEGERKMSRITYKITILHANETPNTFPQILFPSFISLVLVQTTECSRYKTKMFSFISYTKCRPISLTILPTMFRENCNLTVRFSQFFPSFAGNGNDFKYFDCKFLLLTQ